MIDKWALFVCCPSRSNEVQKKQVPNNFSKPGRPYNVLQSRILPHIQSEPASWTGCKISPHTAAAAAAATAGAPFRGWCKQRGLNRVFAWKRLDATFVYGKHLLERLVKNIHSFSGNRAGHTAWGLCECAVKCNSCAFRNPDITGIDVCAAFVIKFSARGSQLECNRVRQTSMFCDVEFRCTCITKVGIEWQFPSLVTNSVYMTCRLLLSLLATSMKFRWILEKQATDRANQSGPWDSTKRICI